jgi:hypothetical protein
MKTARLLILLAALLPFALVFASAGASRHVRQCSDESLRGPYGYRATATVHVPPGTSGIVAYPAAVGHFVADGRGNATGHDVSNVNGVATPRTTTATYTVNADCTGKMEVVFVPGTPLTFFFVIVDKGDELRMITTTPSVRGTVEAIAQ